MAFVPVSYSNGVPVLASDGVTPRVACVHLAEWLQVYDALQVARGRGHVTYYQTMGGADASAGTHLCGSAWDMAYTGDAPIMDAREMGAADWPRLHSLGWPANLGEHVHGLISCGDNACNAYQYTAYWLGYNGLGLNGVGAGDPLPKPKTRRTWREGIDWAKAEIARITTTEDDMGSYIFMRTTEAGNPIYMLAPGQPIRHLTPQEWALWQRLGAVLKGGDTLRAEVDIVNNTIQPAPVAPVVTVTNTLTADEIADKLAKRLEN